MWHIWHRARIDYFLPFMFVFVMHACAVDRHHLRHQVKRIVFHFQGTYTLARVHGTSKMLSGRYMTFRQIIRKTCTCKLQSSRVCTRVYCRMLRFIIIKVRRVVDSRYNDDILISRKDRVT